MLGRVGSDGPYALQARIAAGHTADVTDWPVIASLYDRLARIQPSPVIALNRAVAHGFAHGPADGLRLLADARSGGGLDDYPPADLFRTAAAMAGTEGERRALRARVKEMEAL